MVDCLHTAKQVLDELGHICPLCRIAALEAEVKEVVNVASSNRNYQELLGGYIEGVNEARREGARKERKRIREALFPKGRVYTAAMAGCVRAMKDKFAALGGEVDSV